MRGAPRQDWQDTEGGNLPRRPSAWTAFPSRQDRTKSERQSYLLRSRSVPVSQCETRAYARPRSKCDDSKAARVSLRKVASDDAFRPASSDFSRKGNDRHISRCSGISEDSARQRVRTCLRHSIVAQADRRSREFGSLPRLDLGAFISDADTLSTWHDAHDLRVSSGMDNLHKPFKQPQ